MKHAGSKDALLARLNAEATGHSPRLGLTALVQRQSGLSWLGTFACALLLAAVVADAPVRDMARSLDPSVIGALRVVTQFGNSAWPLGVSALLLGAVTLVAWQANPVPSDALRNLRSALLLVIGSVAISGTIASLTKNMVGRARPSTGDPNVFDFAFLSFQPGWAAFPSGHATTATACAVALAIAFPRHAFAWVSIGLVAALSRSFIGVHWLTDCLAGAALGALVCLALRQRMERRGHAFQIELTLPAKVLVKGGLICLSQAWHVTTFLARQAEGRIRRQFLSRKS